MEILSMAAIKGHVIRFLNVNENEGNRDLWLRNALSALSPGTRILDAGAGELRNKPLCSHLRYVSQDICQYEGTGNAQGLQTGAWNTSNIDLICDCRCAGTRCFV
jgi:hypothetical protein